MATFAELRTSVSKRLLDPNFQSVTSADVDQGINDAISYWKLRRFGFNEQNDFVNMVSQNGVIPLPSDFLVPFTDTDGFTIQYGNVRYPLVKITKQEYDGLWIQNGYGIPRWYAKTSPNEYMVYPLPDQNYQINRHYLKQYVPLVSDGDENDFTLYAARLIQLWTCANLLAELRQDDKMEAYYRKASSDEYRQLRVLSDKENGSGKVTLYSNLLY